ncbi:phage tail tube protein [Paenibacillus dendritiformis]|uniref:phage tail tube protein n=1 Tax=Paenibacillus dendritiformis TaxID=130049 RepID=UPI000DA6E7FE|nr:phage tail tube protein [Paenibacillus dendritiformis]PZM65345.1 phage portal protein [Paenibacillus dendritiformis]
MGFLQAKDTINGQEGRAYAIINGRYEEMFYVKSLEAKIEKEKSEIKTLGRRGTQHKATGWSGSGSMTIYYTTSLFRQIMLDYINKGIDTYFDIQITNEDPTSSIGKQTIILNGVNLDGIVIAQLDTDSDAMEEDIDFTFEGVTMQDSFRSPTLGQ